MIAAAAAGIEGHTLAEFQLFCVFHANLDFSAIPDRDLPEVIGRCYWPLLALAEDLQLPIGLELPARTLRVLEREDPEWLKRFRELCGRGLVEAVGSGWAQSIGPLLPADCNRANLALGAEAYLEILGSVPSTWFVNEQCYSRGIVEHYVGSEVGARGLVMEWNNPATHRSELGGLRGSPVRVAAGAHGALPLLWNDSVVFQKVQRVCHGEIPARDLLELVRRLQRRPGAGSLCLYGGDLEIFDYRPGHAGPEGAQEGREMARLASVLGQVAALAGVRFSLPRDVVSGCADAPIVELASASDPIPTKKQARYNPSRWAVSGRDGLGMNTRCEMLRRTQRARTGLGGTVSVPEVRALASLWASDYRTRATEEKIDVFHGRMGSALDQARAELGALTPPLGEGEDALLANGAAEPWCGVPVEVPVQLPLGRARELRVEVRACSAAGTRGRWQPLNAQVEVDSRHRDGSVRAATLVIETQLEAGAALALRLVSASGEVELQHGPDEHKLETERVRVSLWKHRGGAIASLSFPELGPDPLAGTIAHGHFDDVRYAPDFYSGHVVAVAESGRQCTDLGQAETVQAEGFRGPVRDTLVLRTATRIGCWQKRIRVYHQHPRVDVIHEIELLDARLQSLRLGFLTLLPAAFDRDQLRYATVNGGDEVESFRLTRGLRVNQGGAASPSVSATSCLGATEGWVSLGDDRRGVAAIVDRSRAALAPMVEFSEVDGSFFLRLQHSAAESDETRSTFLRGHHRVGLALLGHANDLAAVREHAAAIQRGLVLRTEAGVGFALGL